jgi:hypothetical protein
MANINSDFEWTKGQSYELANKGAVIRQKGSRKEKFRPLDLWPDLYKDFARLDKPESCLRFANAWGLLKSPARDGAEETFSDWQSGIRAVRGWIRALDIEHSGEWSVVRTANSARIQAKIVSVDLLLRSGAPGTRPMLLLQPRTLLDAMLVRLAQIAATGGIIRECQQCGTPFEVGGNSMRSDSKFCKAKCRNRFNYERRTQK